MVTEQREGGRTSFRTSTVSLPSTSKLSSTRAHGALLLTHARTRHTRLGNCSVRESVGIRDETPGGFLGRESGGLVMHAISCERGTAVCPFVSTPPISRSVRAGRPRTRRPPERMQRRASSLGLTSRVSCQPGRGERRRTERAGPYRSRRNPATPAQARRRPRELSSNGGVVHGPVLQSFSRRGRREEVTRPTRTYSCRQVSRTHGIPGCRFFFQMKRFRWSESLGISPQSVCQSARPFLESEC